MFRVVGVKNISRPISPVVGDFDPEKIGRKLVLVSLEAEFLIEQQYPKSSQIHFGEIFLEVVEYFAHFCIGREKYLRQFAQILQTTTFSEESTQPICPELGT